jgi:hypothetical protein
MNDVGDPCRFRFIDRAFCGEPVAETENDLQPESI